MHGNPLTQKQSSLFLILVVIVTLACATATSQAARQPGFGVAQPTNYVSPSGAYALFVDPTDRYGRGSAAYRLSKNSVEVWSAEKPYTLREVVVTDEGLAAGFAYRTGRDPHESENQTRPVGDPQNPPVFMHIVILDQTGFEVLNEVKELHGRRFHGPTLPKMEQFIVDPSNDRIIARVRARSWQW